MERRRVIGFLLLGLAVGLLFILLEEFTPLARDPGYATAKTVPYQFLAAAVIAGVALWVLRVRSPGTIALALALSLVGVAVTVGLFFGVSAYQFGQCGYGPWTERYHQPGIYEALPGPGTHAGVSIMLQPPETGMPLAPGPLQRSWTNATVNRITWHGPDGPPGAGAGGAPGLAPDARLWLSGPGPRGGGADFFGVFPTGTTDQLVRQGALQVLENATDANGTTQARWAEQFVDQSTQGRGGVTYHLALPEPANTTRLLALQGGEAAWTVADEFDPHLVRLASGGWSIELALETKHARTQTEPGSLVLVAGPTDVVRLSLDAPDRPSDQEVQRAVAQVHEWLGLAPPPAQAWDVEPSVVC